MKLMPEATTSDASTLRQRQGRARWARRLLSTALTRKVASRYYSRIGKRGRNSSLAEEEMNLLVFFFFFKKEKIFLILSLNLHLFFPFFPHLSKLLASCSLADAITLESVCSDSGPPAAASPPSPPIEAPASPSAPAIDARCATVAGSVSRISPRSTTSSMARRARSRFSRTVFLSTEPLILVCVRVCARVRRGGAAGGELVLVGALSVCSLARSRNDGREKRRKSNKKTLFLLLLLFLSSLPQEQRDRLVERGQHGREQDLVLVEPPDDVEGEVAESLYFQSFFIRVFLFSSSGFGRDLWISSLFQLFLSLSHLARFLLTLKSTTASSRSVISAAKREKSFFSSFECFFLRKRGRRLVSRRGRGRRKKGGNHRSALVLFPSPLLFSLTVPSRVDPRRLGEDGLFELRLLGDDRPIVLFIFEEDKRERERERGQVEDEHRKRPSID